MIEPDEAVEIFTSLLILLIGLSVVLKIQGVDIISEVTGLINILVQLFIYAFIGIVVFSTLNEIFE